MRHRSVTFVAASVLLAACARRPAPAAAPASAASKEAAPISYFVRVQGREELLGTLAADGALVRNPALPTGDTDADMNMAAISRLLSVRLDAQGRPLPSPPPPSPSDPTLTWTLADDGTLTWTVKPPAEVAAPPIAFRRGFRVMPDGSAWLPSLDIRYVLKGDGVVLQRFADGREEVEDRWRVEGASGSDKRRTMVGLVILDDFFDTGGGPVSSP